MSTVWITERKYQLLSGAVGTALLMSAGCAVPQVESDQLQVAATTYPLAFFSEQVGGSEAKVVQIIPRGVEAHNWEPSPRDIVTIEQSNVFVFNGAGLEPWGERVAESLEGKSTIVVETTEGLELIEASGEDDHGDDDKDEQGGDDHGDDDKDEQGGDDHGDDGDNEDEHGNEGLDPHVWLSPTLAKLQVRHIANAMVQADPNNRSRYERNAGELEDRLEQLREQFHSGLAQCRTNRFITSHAAFGYLAEEFGLEQVSIAGISPDARPNPARMAELSELVKEMGVKYIFFETLTSPALSETLAQEVGAETLALNPLEGLTPEEVQAGSDYFSVMQKNLANLREALECS